MNPGQLISLILLTAAFLDGIAVDASGEHALCPGQATIPGTVIPCNTDCVSNHGGSGGYCTDDGNLNCICEDQGQHVYGNCEYYFLSGFTVVPQLCQCYTNVTQTFANLYEAGCNLDCTCNHGGRGGVCDFGKRACICDYNFPAGGSWQSSDCDVELLYTNVINLTRAVNAVLNSTGIPFHL